MAKSKAVAKENKNAGKAKGGKENKLAVQAAVKKETAKKVRVPPGPWRPPPARRPRSSPPPPPSFAQAPPKPETESEESSEEEDDVPMKARACRGRGDALDLGLPRRRPDPTAPPHVNRRRPASRTAATTAARTTARR